MNRSPISRRSFLAVPGVFAAGAIVAKAQLANFVCNPSSVSVANTTLTSITLTICTQGSCVSAPGQLSIGGAPFGVLLSYVTQADFAANNFTIVNGSFTGGNAVQQTAPPIAAGACADVVLGSLACGTTYVIRVVLVGGTLNGVTYVENDPTQLSAATQDCAPPPPPGCTHTLGYWKTHASAWPTAALVLGTTTYTKAQLLSILDAPVRGNGLISLAQQLIAAKLNVLAGATCTSAQNYILQADQLIGSLVVPPVGTGVLAPSTTSTLNGLLTSFNEGTLPSCPTHCE